MRRTVQGLAALVGICALAGLAAPVQAAGTTAEAAPNVRAIQVDRPIASTGVRSTDAYPGDPNAQQTPELVTTSKSRPLGERSVIGADGRTQVTNTTAYPSSAIGQLEITQDGFPYICTGWLIDANTILTSGHCAYTPSPTGDNLIEAGSFAPGRNAAVDPQGTCNVLTAFSPVGYRVDGLPKHDWALMGLDCTIGDTVGWLGMFAKQDPKDLVGMAARVRGYPGDKDFGTMWTMSGTIANANKFMAFYKIDTAGGQSGSPVYRPTAAPCAGGPCAMAIHSYGAGGGINANSGPRITPDRLALIIELAAQNDGP